MVEYIKIDSITPAYYNPRKISDRQIEKLKESIKSIGFVIPILVNKSNNTIIAGHQRTRSARACGGETVPCIFVKDISLGDEIKFNQFHNGVEAKATKEIKLKGEHPKEKFLQIPCDNFIIPKETPVKAAYIKEICKLIIKYGNVFSTVVCKGRVLFSDEYIRACKILNLNVNVYICDDEKYNDLVCYLFQDYGEYSYEKIKKNTFVQGLAQMNRNVTKKETIKKQNKSRLYETMVLPYLQKNANTDTSILDFGCGKAAYINMLSKRYDAIGLEFYNNNKKGILVSKGNKMIDDLCDKISINPQFDVVVCDSVLNSVDSVEAENSVMACLNLFCKEKLFISGRNMERIKYAMNAKNSKGKTNYLYFIDNDGFTANYREGQWFFQKFHDEEQIRELIERYGFKIEKINFQKLQSSFQVECRKVKNLSRDEYIKAIDFEFNLPLPNGKRYNRQEDVKKALGFN